MIYRIRNSNYSDFATISRNKLPPRSYFIPFASREEEAGVPLRSKRYRSSLVQVLNGEWDFRYYDDPNEIPEELDTEHTAFARIDVPSCWQFRGWGKPGYINLCYPFPYAPPKIPELEPVKGAWALQHGYRRANPGEYNHVGIYRRFLTIDDLSKKYVLSFLGVCSCIDVYVNGSFAGYSECSHNTAEFDITALLREGENELLCAVHRWSTGTYLECQDMFRNNGIFRDVLLRTYTESSVTDLDFRTEKKETGYTAIVTVATESDCPVTVELKGEGLDLRQEKTAQQGGAVFAFENLSVEEWTAETPMLYDLNVITEDNFIHQRVGFKTVEIVGDRFLLNGSPVKLHGINHHDTDPEEGWTLTPDKLLRDLKLCKEYNIDTIRTSHYAPDPLLLELAAELGLYVIDEVDLETHGAFIQKFPPSYNRISDDSRWTERYVERAQYHYGRDKLLATPILMWSLGNEAGAGCCTDAEYAFFKETKTFPVQYESAIYNKKIMAYDISGNMYPEVSYVESIGNKTVSDKRMCDRPYFLCEYAHAMGVGPGNIEAYWDLIYRYDGLLGGCVWEMNDHAVREENGEYTYGGDHGEWMHDGNFCCDGIFYPDRSPSTGAKLVRHCYASLRLRLNEENALRILNTTGFTPGENFRLDITLSSGKTCSHVPHCAPLKEELLDLGLKDCREECTVDIITVDLRSGEVRDRAQFALNLSAAPATKTGKPFPDWFGLKDGKPLLRIGEEELCPAQEYHLLYRAATDNDRKLFLFNTMKPWYGQKETVTKVTEEYNRMTVETRITAAGKLFRVTDTYESTGEAVLVTSRLHCSAGVGKLPRFAESFRLPERFDRVTWEGCEEESYRDMRIHTRVGTFHRGLREMTEPNVRPQESGNRMDSKYVSITDGKTEICFEAVDKRFELGVKPYSDRELISMKHRSDEKVSGCYVSLSAFQQGIGTGSCGPETEKEYLFPVKEDRELRFLILLRPTEKE